MLHHDWIQMPSLLAMTKACCFWPVSCWVSVWSESPLPVSLTGATTSCLTGHMAKALWVRENELSFSKLKFVESTQQIKITFLLILSLRKTWPSIQHQTAAEKYTEQEIREKPHSRQRQTGEWKLGKTLNSHAFGAKTGNKGPMLPVWPPSRWQLLWFHNYYLILRPSQQTLKFQNGFWLMRNS